VTQSGTIYTITEGTRPGNGPNLFHSFDRFSIGTGDTASFSGPTGIANIVSRVTGGQPSSIDGILRSEITGANLYLLNPSGVLFGSNARLEISGSFHVSTADFLRFGDEATFAADRGQASTLTVAEPAAFGFLGSPPAPITIQGSRLQVPAGNALSVVGGDLEIVGREPLTAASTPTLGAPRGRIQLASVAAPGEVGFSPLALAPDLQVDSFARLGRIALSQGAFVDASGNGGGVVLLRGGRLFVDHAWMFADNTGPIHGAGIGLDLDIRADAAIRNSTSLTTDSLGAGRARDLQLTAGHLHLDGAVVGSGAFAAGDSGHVEVRVGTLTVTGGGQLDSSTQDGSTGHGGRLTVTATDAVAITGPNSGLVNVAFGTGRVGEITVEARQLTLTEGAIVRNHSFLINNPGGGRVTLTTTEAVVMAGSSVSSNGPITIRAPTVRLAAGSVGNPTFNISDAADIVITAGAVTLTEGALVTSNTLGAGRGGDIRLQGDRVTLTGGARITSDTFGGGAEDTGAGGRVTLTATDGITITGQDSGLFTETRSHGPGGDITLEAREVRLRDGATLSAVSFGAGDAGRLTLTATEHLRLDRSTLTARAAQANGGVIVLEAGHGVQLWDGSTITASVEGGPTTVGGNLTITAPFVVLEGSQEGSQIIAQATKGAGGRIVITSPVLLAEPTPADPTGLTRVSASSTEGGISGLVDIRAPVTTLSGAVAPLPQAFVNVAALLPARCAARLSGGSYSSLVVGGRGGLPLEPGGVLPSPLRLDARLAAEPAGGVGQSRQTARARGALLAAEELGFPRLRGAEALGLAPALRDGGCPP
jgi:filamentous hemagglutinin family protein